MLRNKFKAAVIIALIAVNSVFAAEGYKPKEPKKGHVLVVGKIAYKKPIDIAAREKNFREYKNRQIVIEGITIGILIVNKVLNGDDPSISAASRTSVGMFCSPAI